MESCRLCHENISGRCRKTIFDRSFCHINLVSNILGSNNFLNDRICYVICEVCKTKLDKLSSCRRTIERLSAVVHSLEQEQLAQTNELRDLWAPSTANNVRKTNGDVTCQDNVVSTVHYDIRNALSFSN